MARMNTGIALSSANVIFASVLVMLGQHTYDLLRRPLQNGDRVAIDYLPVPVIVSYCINAPALPLARYISNAGNNLTTGNWLPSWWSLSRYGDGAYFLTVFVFWWWIGRQIDRRSRIGKDGRLPATLICLLGFVYSLLLVWQGGGVFFHGSQEGRAIGFSMIVWAVSLICYFGWKLRRSLFERPLRQ